MEHIVTMNPTSYMDATGPIDYGMTNDYMFRSVLQRNTTVLKGLICSLLHLNPDDVSSVVITNPIDPGDDINAKEFILDINVLLNNSSTINLEMQMENQLNWQDRSLSYLCRSYDQLYRGQKYTDTKPAIHIGFLNFSPFEDSQEFYATYKLLNVKNHHLYSDKFILSVVDLTHIELATDEDKANQIDYWAKLFKATSWEEIRMISKNNNYLSEASQALYELNADEITRQKCRAREEYYRTENTYKKMISDLQAQLQQTITEKDSAITEKDNAIAEKDNTITEKDNTISVLMQRIAELEGNS